MGMRRVVVTGMGAVSPFGQGVDVLEESLLNGKSGIIRVPELETTEDLKSHVAGIARDIDPMEIPRKYRRSMSMMSIYSVLACREALKMGQVPDEYLGDEGMGVIIGSTIDSINTFESFFESYLVKKNMEEIRSTIFFKLMNHSCAFNVSQALGIRGRVVAHLQPVPPGARQ